MKELIKGHILHKYNKMKNTGSVQPRLLSEI